MVISMSRKINSEKKRGHTNIYALGRILSRDTSVYTAVRTLRCSPSVHITDIIFHYFWFVCKKYTPIWLVTISNALNFATVWPASLFNSGFPEIRFFRVLRTKHIFIFQEGFRKWNCIMFYWEYFLHIFVK